MFTPPLSLQSLFGKRAFFTWEINLAATDNQLHLLWQVRQVSMQQKGQTWQVVTHQIAQQELADGCDVIGQPGDVQISHERIHFAGKGALRCKLPPFVAAVRTWLNDPTFTCESALLPPYMAAEFAVDPQSESANLQPLLALSSNQAETTSLQRQQTVCYRLQQAAQQGHMHLAFGEGDQTQQLIGEAFSLVPNRPYKTFDGFGARLLTEYADFAKLDAWLNEPSWLAAASKGEATAPVHWHNQSVVNRQHSVESASCPANFRINPEMQWLYLGYDPTMERFFTGSLLHAKIDPPCRGTGSDVKAR